ncbi:SNF2 family N-terminal domain containing protein [Trichomonas vaginalis G3]|uniref:SNF2 family N-terminal domain containing protein n=1 Tax=Trichomonas vaginalis (strain ATCC PRA-98 / G3) TaxID=412133 RepID=A2ED18_TRIV3|nr:helicase protein [Trichomonas vaginalis G3]EAY09469.1 SNF2 family N-terminal domain containing protein [Trichomonas vaginalis G3]KAI5523229.1 helicase protein [Trichomonas vaginalis G3]|eukprot:XP_001321692.1 SNF2 family N-terminal domain containing protein [Trichomonas vaginalis G3]
MSSSKRRKSGRASRSSSHEELEFSDTSTESEEMEELNDEEEQKPEEEKQNAEKPAPKLPFFLSYFNPPEGLPEPPIPYEPPPPQVQAIIGMKEEENEPSPVDQVYFTKWIGRAYIHASYECQEDLKQCDGGDLALKKFNNKLKGFGLTASTSQPELSTFDPDDINSGWFEVDRIIAHENNKYLVKWGNLPYDQATWESEEDLPEPNKIDEFIARKDRCAPMHTPDEPKIDSKLYTKIETPLEDKRGNTLRDYQLQGLNWLRYCWYNHYNSILADEMGLGKTVQLVTTLIEVSKASGIRGPYLVLAPLSTLHHWEKEFQNWSDLNVIVYHGCPLAKEVIQRYELCKIENGVRDTEKLNCEVVITNYETFMSDFEIFRRVEWRYLVLDEGHRLKNHQSKCYGLLQQLSYKHCTLLTGTPIQNNVEELWSLLHLLQPELFDDLPAFLQEFGQIDNAQTLQNLQQVIKPFLLRRKKSDVETTIAAKEETIIQVELTRTQKTFYRAFLDENRDVLLSQITSGALPSLKNLMMQLRKVCNHPYLIKGATDTILEQFTKASPENTPKSDIELKALVQSSGKLILIDKLLPKLKADGHKVLIFSQMVKVLDILEDYIAIKGYKCERIDGSVAENDRQAAIERFGNDPDAFIFLLCTKAGGVGINLTAADTVIIYDSDWNPQNDIQAQSRCHRIGQTQKVKVYRLVTRGTYELDMLDRASKKLGLDHALLDSVEVSNNPKMEAQEIDKLLRRGVYDIANDDDTEIEKFCAADIDQILLDRSHDLKTNESKTDSSFSKATFSAETNDGIDVKDKDFWQKMMPKITMKVEKPLEQRRCRQHKTQSTIYESDDGDDDKPRRRGSTPSGIRQYIRDICKHGFKGSAGERTVLYTAAEKALLDPADVAIILHLLNIESFDDRPEDIVTMQEKYSGSLKECIEKQNSIIGRTMLFYNLSLILTGCAEDLKTWPVSGVDDDPLYEYALMYAVAKNGFVDADKLFQGTGYHTEKQLLDKDTVRIVKQLVKNLGVLAANVEQADKDFMTPEEWKQAHENLFNRTILSDEEYILIFQLIVLYGIPEPKYPPAEGQDPKLDFYVIHEMSNLKCLKYEAIEQCCQEITDLAQDKLAPGQTDMVLKRLKDYGNRIWMKKLRDNNRELRRIRNFLERMAEDEKQLIPKMRSFESAPDWWSAEFDIALMKALAQYGLVYVSVFLVDENLPFLAMLPEGQVEQFKNAAEQEKQKGRPVKPKDVGDLNVLYNDKHRLGRITSLINFVDSRLNRQQRLESNDSPDGPISYQPTITELPSLPLDITQTLTIVDFGHFKPGFESYPVGYVAKRQYFSLEDPNEKAWYEASTKINEENQFRFVVKPIDDDVDKVFESHTSSGAWEALIQEIQTVKARKGMPKRKHTTVSGPFMYGFSADTVAACLRFLRDQDLNQ